MSTFVFRLQAPRPSFALDMSDEEREIVSRRAAYWQPLIDSGKMVVFVPVFDDRDWKAADRFCPAWGPKVGQLNARPLPRATSRSV
jgi:hypothetical protein